MCIEKTVRILWKLHFQYLGENHLILDNVHFGQCLFWTQLQETPLFRIYIVFKEVSYAHQKYRFKNNILLQFKTMFFYFNI